MVGSKDDDTVKLRNIKPIIAKKLPSNIMRLYRKLRHLTLVALYPFEYILNYYNEDMLPSYLRRYVGSPKHFISSAQEFLTYLIEIAIEIAHLKLNEKMLDLGCGCGSDALALNA